MMLKENTQLQGDHRKLIIWSTIMNNENIEYCSNMSIVFPDMIILEKIEDLIEIIKNEKEKSIWLIISGSRGRELKSQKDSSNNDNSLLVSSNIHKIYVFCADKNFQTDWTSDIKEKISIISVEYSEIVDKIIQDYIEFIPQESKKMEDHLKECIDSQARQNLQDELDNDQAYKEPSLIQNFDMDFAPSNNPIKSQQTLTYSNKFENNNSHKEDNENKFAKSINLIDSSDLSIISYINLQPGSSLNENKDKILNIEDLLIDENFSLAESIILNNKIYLNQNNQQGNLRHTIYEDANQPVNFSEENKSNLKSSKVLNNLVIHSENEINQIRTETEVNLEVSDNSASKENIIRLPLSSSNGFIPKNHTIYNSSNTVANSNNQNIFKNLPDYDFKQINKETSSNLYLSSNINVEGISEEIFAKYNDYFSYYPDIINSSKNKDICVIVGNTGVGKTTLINYLAGRELIVENEKEDIYGNLTGGIISLKNPLESKAMKIGHGRSETTLPNFIKINDIYLYDLPGLGDNRGEAKVILNAFIIKNIIENALSVKIIFVTSPSELESARGDKFKSLIEVAKNAFYQENFQNISCLVINKSTFLKVNDVVAQIINKDRDVANLIWPWHECNKIGKMCAPGNGKIRQQDRQEIMDLISSLKGQKIKLNSQKLFSKYEETIIENIIYNELEAINDELLQKYDSNLISNLNSEQLKNLKNEIETNFNSILDSHLFSNKLISIVSYLANDSFQTSLNEIKNSSKKQVTILNLNNLIITKVHEENVLKAQEETRIEKRKNFIRSVQVIYSFSRKSDVTVPSGYTKISQDLNQGCKGWFLFIAFSKELHHGNPLLDITSYNNGRRGVRDYIGSGWECIRANDGSCANTNRSLGKKGDDISLFASRSDDINFGITDICVGSFDNPSDFCPPGYTRLAQDLSQGGGGKYIYLAYKKEQI